jgi:uncharacterized damage-inducible protein DinB
MITFCSDNLKEIKSMINSMDNEQYTAKSALLSNSSIGQHVRHILEFYICLLDGYHKGVVNYDKRERNISIEIDNDFASNSIDSIIENFEGIGEDAPLQLEASFNGIIDDVIIIKSSIARELAYCLEHSIHHQALIKIGLHELKCDSLVNSNFGVAPATIRYKKECAQ